MKYDRESIAEIMAGDGKLSLQECREILDDYFNTTPYKTVEELAAEYAEKYAFQVPYDGSNKFYDDKLLKGATDGFIAGAKHNTATSGMVKNDEVLCNKLNDIHTELAKTSLPSLQYQAISTMIIELKQLIKPI